MQRRRWIRVSSRAALGGAVLLLLTSCSASDLEKRLRFGWPTGVTKQAERMRVLWSWSGVVALAMGVLVWGLIFWACGRYHKRNDEIPRQTKYNLPIEIVYTVVPLMIVAGLFFFTVRVEDYVDIANAQPERDGPGQCIQVELAIRVPEGQRHRSELPRGLTAAAAVDGRIVRRDPHSPHSAGTDSAVRRALRGRHSFLLGAGVPVQARCHSVRHGFHHS